MDQNMMTQLGMMNKLSSGNMVLDVILCLILPVVLAQFTQYAETAKQRIKNFFLCGGGYSRVIEYATVEGYYFHDENNSRNKVLQEAIFRYMDSNPDISSKLKAAKYQLIKDREVLDNLSETDEPGSDSDSDSSYFSSSDSDCDNRSKEILSYKIQVIPPEDVKFEVEEGVSLVMTRRQETIEAKKSKWIRSLTLTSHAKDARVLIDGFAERALSYYKLVEGGKKDESRYFYTPLLSRSRAEATNSYSPLMFKRYELSEEKTFASFFHPKKEELLHLVDNFLNKKGKFAVPGYPHKLGLLLHGPPGTGKTSLIKALANHTRRHIISIPLSRVKTNQDLMDLVLDQACKVEGNDWTYKLPFRKTIFVMEDVDAAADVVHKRSEQGPRVIMCAASKTKPGVASKFEKGANEAEESDDAIKEDKQPMKMQGVSGMGAMAKWLVPDDELNLAGILNVLDGVIDCPNRLVVMTTNHPEKLDPALIRPGRINKKLYLGLLRVEEATLMIERYYGTLQPAENEKLNNIFPPDRISPAAMECLCAECDTIGDLFAGLHELIDEIE